MKCTIVGDVSITIICGNLILICMCPEKFDRFLELVCEIFVWQRLVFHFMRTLIDHAQYKYYIDSLTYTNINITFILFVCHIWHSLLCLFSVPSLLPYVV